MSKSVIILNSVSQVLRAEKKIKSEGIEVELIPTPRHLSSDCGTSIVFCSLERQKIEGILKESNISFSAIHEI